jgi:hypothetical protein
MRRLSSCRSGESSGDYGEQMTDSEKLQDALERGLEANRSGKPAIID